MDKDMGEEGENDENGEPDGSDSGESVESDTQDDVPLAQLLRGQREQAATSRGVSKTASDARYTLR